MEEKEKRGSGLLGYFTLVLMTAAIVVSILLMVISRNVIPAVLLGAPPVLVIISFLAHRVELGLGEHLPSKLMRYALQLILWLAAALVLWLKYDHGGLDPAFVMLLAVIVRALYLLVQVIHAMGEIKVRPVPAAEEAPKAEEKPAEEPVAEEKK